MIQRSTRHQVVALSSAEAELHGIYHSVRNRQGENLDVKDLVV